VQRKKSTSRTLDHETTGPIAQPDQKKADPNRRISQGARAVDARIARLRRRICRPAFARINCEAARKVPRRLTRADIPQRLTRKTNDQDSTGGAGSYGAEA